MAILATCKMAVAILSYGIKSRTLGELDVDNTEKFDVENWGASCGILIVF